MVSDDGSPLASTPSQATSFHRLSPWEREIPLPGSLSPLFEAQVLRTPEAIALLFEEQHWTYQDLNMRATTLAHVLRSQHVGPEVPVAVFLHHSPLLVIAVLAIHKAGGVYLPLDPQYPPDRLTYMLTDARASLLLTVSSLVTSLPTDTVRVLCLDHKQQTNGQQEQKLLLNQLHPDNLAYIIYTSGSTGRPKGTLNTHRGIVNRMIWGQSLCQITTTDTLLLEVSSSFDVFIWELYWPLIAGAKLLLARPGGQRDPSYLVHVLYEQQVSIAHFSPSLLQALLDEPVLERCVHLRHIFCGGEVLSLSLQERCWQHINVNLHNQYGPTETAAHMTHWLCRHEPDATNVPIGFPITNMRIHLLDADLRPVTEGSPGELYIGGPGVGRGYLDQPALTAERFLPDPFSQQAGMRLYRSGDMVRQRANGALEFLGRLDKQVKIRGFRVELEEIEAVLCQHPMVREAVVCIRQESTGDAIPIAYVVPAQEDIPQTNELRAFLERQLPWFMLPAAWVALSSFPLTTNGKIDRAALPLPDQARYGLSTVFQAPRTDTEKKLSLIWKQVLGVEQVGIYDDFFELGGHSLKATQVIARVRTTFFVEVSLLDFFMEPTILSLAEIIEEIAQEASGQQRYS